MRYLFASVCAVLVHLAVPGQAHAQLAVDRLWVDLDASREPRADILVRNDSNDRYYINVQVTEVVNPGEEAEARVTNADPEAVGLLVTPNRMIMDPGTQRSIRLVTLNDDLAKDRVYRVLVSPAVGDLLAADAPEGGRSLAVKILTAFEVLVVDRPIGAHPKITAERLPSEVIIRNEGGTNALLYDGLVCDKGERDLDRCTDVPINRLYSGGMMKIPLTAPDQVVTLKQRSKVSEDPVSLTF